MTEVRPDSGTRRDDAPADPRVVQVQAMALVVAALVGMVLRVWDLGGPVATVDESFTGVYSHLPLGQIPAALRADDAHPPLDYLLRHFFGVMGGTFALRVPSAVFGCLTVLVVAVWMWRRGWFGVAVVAFTSLSPFQLQYAHEARMYALAILCGTVAAASSEAWLRRGSPRLRWLVGGALLIALFDVSTGLLLAGGLILIPGWRRDREAWRWRLVVVGAVAIWAAVWGASFAHQSTANRSGWIPFTSVAALRDTVGGFLTVQSGLAWVGVALVVLGAFALWYLDRVLARVLILLLVAPLVVSALAGVRFHFLLTRTLATSAWAIPVAVAALVEQARRRGALMGVLVALLVGVVMVRSIPIAMNDDDGSAVAVAALATHVGPGDAVAVYPSLWPLRVLTVWDAGAPTHPIVPASVTRVAPRTFVYVEPGAPFSGTLWVLASTGFSVPAIPLPHCQPTLRLGAGYTLACYRLRTGSAGAGSGSPPATAKPAVTPPG